MARTNAEDLPPTTLAVHHALQERGGSAFAADVLLLQAWEASRPMHLGIMLRVQQIRRANPQLYTEIASELAERRTATRSKVPAQ